jgi:hypothetical protein
MIATRDSVATELDIDASLIAARAVIESIADGESDPQTALLSWQRECLGIA